MAVSSHFFVADKEQEHVANREMIRRFVRELDTLPSPSFVAAGLLNALMYESPDPREIQGLVELDQATSMKLLRYANSPSLAPTSPIVSIPQAVALSGVSQLRDVLCGVAISETLIKGPCEKPSDDHAALWRHALACGVCARTLAERVLPNLAHEAYALGLLHDVGKLILKECVPDRYKEVEAIHRDVSVSIMEAEEKVLGIDHATVGKWLAERWGLPLLLVQGIWLHHHSFEVISELDFASTEHRKLILILRLANDLAHEITADSEMLHQAPVAGDDAPAALLGLRPEDLERARASAEKRRGECIDLHGSPEGELSSYLGALQRANQKSARLGPKEAQIQAREKMIQDLSRLHDFQADLSCVEDSEDLLERIVRELADGFGKQDGIIYLLRKRTRKLIGRQWSSGKLLKAFSLDLNEDDSPVRHDIPFPENHISQLIQTGHTRFRRVTRENRQRILFQYSKPYLIIPLIVEGELGGEIFISNGDRGELQNEANLTVYRHLADGAAQALSRIHRLEEVRENAEMLNVALSKSMQGAVREASLQKEALLGLAAEKERLEATFRSIPAGIIASDTDGNIVFCNKAAETWTGWSEVEAVGKPLDTVFTIINTRVDSLFENPLDRMVEKSNSRESSEDVAIVSKGGAGRLITLDAARACDRDNRIVGTVIVLRDLTARKKAEEELSRSRKLESARALAGGVALDFNSFLTLIMGNISLARAAIESGRGNPAERLSEAEKACLTAQDLTRQLSVLSNEGRSFKRRQSVAEAVKDAVTGALSGTQIHCRLDLPRDLLPVYCDSGQIHQMIGNLVLNARDAVPDGESIEVEAENVLLAADEVSFLKKGEYVRISIKDHGKGIPRENITKIFDPYFSAEKKVYHRGMGLGLAVAYSIIRAHEGSVVVESEEGVGSAFHVYLPSAENVVAATEVDTVTQLSEVLDKIVTKSERRRHPRVEVRWPVAALTGDESMVEGETRDISLSGARISLRDMLEPGADFRMIIKPSDAGFVSVTSEVIWSRIHGKGKGASPMLQGMGVRFRELRNEDRELLTKLVSN